jgi:hypothetical protein
MKRSQRIVVVVVTLFVGLGLAAPPPASAQAKKPNILVIMGDDVGWSISALTIVESCRARRPTSTSWPRRE